MSRIFISYSRKDEAFARKLARSLSEMGADIWIDVNDIPAGMKWSTAIQQGLNLCQAMLVVVSPDSMASSNVEDEWQYYLDKKKLVVPIWYRPAEMHFQLNRIQYVDFCNVGYHAAFERLIDELRTKGVPFNTMFEGEPSVGEGLGPLPTPPETLPPSASARSPLPEGEGQGMRAQSPITLPDVSAILPPPFEWCWIPAGRVTLEADGYVPKGGQTFDIPAFAIAKYPITNAQFEVFVQARDGYRNADWWGYSENARAWRKQNVMPRDPAFDGAADHPRVYVNWYEAVGFCRWLTETVGARHAAPLPITLPTEQQWQRAAQGDDGREYPWGNEPNTGRCNVKGSKIGQTTSVIQYPDGTSPYGVMDMSGNVQEWCLTDFESGLVDMNKRANYRVLRGGSWNNDVLTARCASRFRFNPYYWDSDWGFRVVGMPV